MLTVTGTVTTIRRVTVTVTKKGESMSEKNKDFSFELNVKALAAMLDMSIAELAKEAGIDKDHLLSVSSGRVKMTAKDLQKLSSRTGIPAKNIKA